MNARPSDETFVLTALTQRLWHVYSVRLAGNNTENFLLHCIERQHTTCEDAIPVRQLSRDTGNKLQVCYRLIVQWLKTFVNKIITVCNPFILIVTDKYLTRTIVIARKPLEELGKMHFIHFRCRFLQQFQYDFQMIVADESETWSWSFLKLEAYRFFLQDWKWVLGPPTPVITRKRFLHRFTACW